MTRIWCTHKLYPREVVSTASQHTSQEDAQPLGSDVLEAGGATTSESLQEPKQKIPPRETQRQA